MDFGIIILAVSNITDAELCKGSTTDSDSVCEGSNPSSAAKAPLGAKFRGVAQLGRALRSGRRGRWFESSHLDHSEKPYQITVYRLFDTAFIFLFSA